MRGDGSSAQGDSPWHARRYPRGVMSSTATAHRLLAARPGSGTLRRRRDRGRRVRGHAGAAASRRRRPDPPPDRGELDLVGVVLAACSTVPLVAWRRFPLGVFAVTAAASVLLAGLGYPVDLMLGPDRCPLPARRQPRAGDPVDGAHHRHRRRAARGVPGRDRRRARHLSGNRAAPHRSGLGRGLVRRRADPPAARAHGRPQSNAPCAPSGRPSASGCSPSPRNAPGSPAICTTPPATRSA